MCPASVSDKKHHPTGVWLGGSDSLAGQSRGQVHPNDHKAETFIPLGLCAFGLDPQSAGLAKDDATGTEGKPPPHRPHTHVGSAAIS
jgi:hypothetical protein